jgi:hypothetical protein
VTTRLGLAAAILLVVAVVAWVLRRRPADPPPRDVFPVPAQLDRSDFPRPDAPWLVVLFSSSVCDSCQGLVPKIAPLESAEVAVCEIEASVAGDLHRRYEVAAIPTTVIADAQGVVRRGFVGAFTATDLWAAVAETRDPGSTPEPRLGEVPGRERV